MIDEVSNSISSVFKERFVSPLFGTLLISWVVWNWRLLYYLFAVDSKVDVSQRFAYIDQHFINASNFGSSINLFFGPIILSVLWLWLYPIISSNIETYLAQKRAAKLMRLQKIEKTIPLTHEEAMAIYEKAEKQEERYAKLSKDNVERIAKLNEQNQHLTNEKQGLIDSEKYYCTELNTTQKKLTDFTVENENLKAVVKGLNQELQIAKFGKWANKELIINAYSELLQQPSLSKLYATLLSTPNLQYPGHTYIRADREELEGLMNLGLLSSIGEKENGEYSISFTDRGWQLLSLFRLRQELEKLLNASHHQLKHLPSLSKLQ